MGQLDAELHFRWLNRALAELLGADMLRWQGASLEVIEPGAWGVVDAAPPQPHRALASSHSVRVTGIT